MELRRTTFWVHHHHRRVHPNATSLNQRVACHFSASCTASGVASNNWSMLQFFANNYLYQLQSTTIMMAAIDRVIAIAKPLKYHCNGKFIGKVLLVSLGVIWVVLSPLCGATLLFANAFQWLPSLTACAAQFKQPHFIKVIMVLQYLLAYIIPGVVIVLCYAIIAAKIRKRARKKSQFVAAMTAPMPRNAVSGRDELGQRQQLSICKILIFITILYYVSFLPFFVYQCLVYFLEFDINASIFRGLKMFRNLSTLTDGLVFYGMSNSFQVGLQQMFTGRRNASTRTANQRRPHQQTGRQVLSHCSGGSKLKTPHGNAVGGMAPNKRLAHQYAGGSCISMSSSRGAQTNSNHMSPSMTQISATQSNICNTEV